MKRSEKLKIKLADLVRSGQERTTTFDEVVERLATAISDERTGVMLYRVGYLRRVDQCGSIWVRATDEVDALTVAEEVLHSDSACEDDRVVRFEDATDEDAAISFDARDATEVDDEEEDE